MLSRALTLFSLLALVPAGPALAAKKHRVDGKLGDWRGKPTQIAGTTTTSRGEYIYTDWLYDDHGPHLDGAADVTLLGSFGDVSAGSLSVEKVKGGVRVSVPAGTTNATVTPAG